MLPVEPALARAEAEIPSETALKGGSRYEPKFDGWRLIAQNDGGKVTLWSRHGTDLTRYLPDIEETVREHLPDGFTLDGEVVVWSDDGARLDFPALQRRLQAGRGLRQVIREHPAHYVAFDLLELAGRDITSVPFRDRRALLEELAKGWEPPLSLCPQTNSLDTAREWFRDMPASGIEGIVAKGAGEPYRPGVRQWSKAKHHDTIDVICAAISGTLTRPGQLVVGLPIDGQLRIVGRTSLLTVTASKTLGRYLEAPGAEHPWPEEVSAAAVDRFNGGRGTVELKRVTPIVVEVTADTAFDHDHFRHRLRYVRPRPEMDVADVEVPEILKR